MKQYTSSLLHYNRISNFGGLDYWRFNLCPDPTKYVRTHITSTLIPYIRAVRYDPKFAYHDTIALVSRYTLSIEIWLIMT